jgi:hypothetical protein
MNTLNIQIPEQKNTPFFYLSPVSLRNETVIKKPMTNCNGIFLNALSL